MKIDLLEWAKKNVDPRARSVSVSHRELDPPRVAELVKPGEVVGFTGPDFQVTVGIDFGERFLPIGYREYWISAAEKDWDACAAALHDQVGVVEEDLRARNARAVRIDFTDEDRAELKVAHEATAKARDLSRFLEGALAADAWRKILTRHGHPELLKIEAHGGDGGPYHESHAYAPMGGGILWATYDPGRIGVKPRETF